MGGVSLEQVIKEREEKLVEALTGPEVANIITGKAATVSLGETVSKEFLPAQRESYGVCSQGYSQREGGSEDVYANFPREFQSGVRLRSVIIGDYTEREWEFVEEAYEGDRSGSYSCEEGTGVVTNEKFYRTKKAVFIFEFQSISHRKLTGGYVYGGGRLHVVPPNPGEGISGSISLDCFGPRGWFQSCPEGWTGIAVVYAIREYLGLDNTELQAFISQNEDEIARLQQPAEQQARQEAERARREEERKKQEEEAKSKGLFER